MCFTTKQKRIYSVDSLITRSTVLSNSPKNSSFTINSIAELNEHKLSCRWMISFLVGAKGPTI